VTEGRVMDSAVGDRPRTPERWLSDCPTTRQAVRMGDTATGGARTASDAARRLVSMRWGDTRVRGLVHELAERRDEFWRRAGGRVAGTGR
jgi:hypothetical protein